MSKDFSCFFRIGGNETKEWTHRTKEGYVILFRATLAIGHPGGGIAADSLLLSLQIFLLLLLVFDHPRTLTHSHGHSTKFGIESRVFLLEVCNFSCSPMLRRAFPSHVPLDSSICIIALFLPSFSRNYIHYVIYFALQTDHRSPLTRFFIIKINKHTNDNTHAHSLTHVRARGCKLETTPS